MIPVLKFRESSINSCPGALELVRERTVILSSGAPTYVGTLFAGNLKKVHCE